MLKIFLYISALYLSVIASGDLTVLHTPKSIEFKGHDNLESETLSDLLSATLGLSVENPSGWNGLYINDPFNMPKALIAIAIDGLENINIPQKSQSYNLIGSSSHDALDMLTATVEQHHKVIDLDLSQGFDSLKAYSRIFGDIKPTATEKSTSSLKPQVYTDDKLFLQQLSILNIVGETLLSLEEKPTLITIRISLTSLINAHTLASPAITDAVKLLTSEIEKLVTSTEKSYDNNCLIVLITNKEELSRSKRQTSAIPANLNLALIYSADYPVIFNIILWFGVVFAFSLLAICLVIGTMDPGRDSIIYRMTLNRMKKEN